jgi:hypothetical protein
MGPSFPSDPSEAHLAPKMELSNPSDRVSTLGLCITGSLSLHSSGQRTGDILDKIAATPSKTVVLYSICNLLNGLVL